MLTLRTLVISSLIVCGAIVNGSPLERSSSSAPPCGSFDETTRSYIVCASDAGEGTGNGTAPSGDVSSNENPDNASNASATTDPCVWRSVDPQPLVTDEIWKTYLPAGANPADYTLVYSECEKSGVAGTIEAVRTATPAGAAPVVDPEVVAREAIARLPIPVPSVGIGPDRSRVAVNLPVWLWVGDPGVLTASASQGPVTVTAEASLASVTWSMGEPGAAPVTCSGAGRAPWPGADLRHPPCGYTYRLRSLPARTGGAGVWPVTAAAVWAISWRSNTGVSGTDSVTTRSVTALNVGEWRSVIVFGG